MYKYIFLDLDGTLTDPYLGITNSVKYALKKFNIDKDNSELKCFIGPPLRDSFRDYYNMNSEEAELAVKYYREYFSTVGLFENDIYPFTINVLDELKSLGVKIVLATSKPEKFSIEILKHFNIYHYFDFCSCATMDKSRDNKSDIIKYALETLNINNTDEVLMVGDRHHDIIGAHNSNIKCCYVLYGYGSKSEGLNNNAEYIIDNLDELIDIIKGS